MPIPPVRLVSGDMDPAMDPALAWNGSGWGVAWSDGTRIWFARLDAAGRSVGESIPVGTPARRARHARLVWTSDGYGVAWDDVRGRPDRQDVRFARLDAEGLPLGPDLTVSSSSCGALFPTLVWTGSDFGLAWEDCRDNDWEIYFASVDRGGDWASAPRRITASPENSMMPAMVWDGVGYGVTWSDLRPLPDNGDNYEILFTRLDAAGVALGPDIRMTTAPGSGLWPSLAWTGSDYVLAWHDRRDDPDLLLGRIFTVRLDAAGQPYEPPNPISDPGRAADTPALLWTGDELALTWAEAGLVSGSGSVVRMARLTSAMVPMGRPLTVSRAARAARKPSLSWSGTAFGVTWDDTREGDHDNFFAAVRCDCVDEDDDGYLSCFDCDDTSARIHPGAIDLPGDRLDQDCDGTPQCDSEAEGQSRGERISCVERVCAALIQGGRVKPWECGRPFSRGRGERPGRLLPGD